MKDNQYDKDLQVLFKVSVVLDRVHLVATEEVQCARVDPLSEDVLGKGLGQDVPLQEGHPAVQQLEPAQKSGHVSWS